MEFSVEFKTRWADFDVNKHMRHTAYNDYAAETRIRYFKTCNVTLDDFTEHNVGPILFEENTSFRKEIHLGENITCTIKLVGVSKNAERWKIRNEIFNEAGKLAAVINVFGAWLDLTKRKLTTPPEKFKNIFTDMPKTDDYKDIIIKK
ncbi:acyl-CoA thioester hydrolase [Lutibacter sp. Hel_I_33_5]|uniref:acyl-CoA thioesterase n=1 Tax=Lutibacter sp. Hel_I_33_5 TaxID=1566289 RepID=UPI0011A8339F|nr:acyl-CoA thioesterase [Lutibacter sp. Hel_I_33_5]TVZ55845.1 acyl-CoA thioester hydrolase [Lutibacter sp. Hel_I_33_5]